jgi:hypothetical protein
MAILHLMARIFNFLNDAGEPMLPYKVMQVLLPPDTDLSTVTASLINADILQVNGVYDIKPTSPACTWDGTQVITYWPEGKIIVDGKDVDIYNNYAIFPQNNLHHVPRTGQIRQWKLVTISIALYQCNPVSKELFKLNSGQVSVSYTESSTRDGSLLHHDNIAKKRARELAINYDEIASQYDQVSRAPVGPLLSGYAIITTNAIKYTSSQLQNFVDQKTQKGFTVHVITEETWGGGIGDTASENIREWLKANYLDLNIEYVLLIGDPHPETGDVPMKMLWPGNNFPSEREAPSDYYYSDLTGNWDLDGDGIYGEAGI